MNHIFIAGHLGADPETRFTSGGQKVTTLRVATNSRRAGKEETIWWRVTIWGDQFDKMMPYLKKGSSIMIFGDMQKPEIYNDREGRPQISMNMTANHISFSPFGRGQNQEGTQNQFAGQTPQNLKPKKEESSFGSGGFDQFGSGGFGGESSDSHQDQQQNQFSDEEIPF
ncbi:MAG: single-stranded DNA-binding protein [Simkaniaceae bacterium]